MQPQPSPMENLSEPQCKAVSPWRGLLIIASILSCWIQPTSAQLTIVPNPPYGEVNHNVTLDIQGYTEQAASYAWFRNEKFVPQMIAIYRVERKVQEPAGIQEKVLPNGSLFIPHLTLNDTDKYCVVIIDSQGNVTAAERHFTVYERTTKPHFTANSTNVIENDTLDFTCGINQKRGDILWFFNNKTLILNERMKLSMNNQTLTILSVKREDAGTYECKIWTPISSSRSDPITLTVNYGPDYIMFVPNPEKGEIEVKFNDSITLECHVESYPPAQYIWQVNGTVNSDFSSNTYVIKNVTWKDSGKYTCLAKNNVTKLSVSKSITIKVVAQSSFFGGLIIGIMIGALAGISIIVSLIYNHFRKTGRADKTRENIPQWSIR